MFKYPVPHFIKGRLSTGKVVGRFPTILSRCPSCWALLPPHWYILSIQCIAFFPSFDVCRQGRNLRVLVGGCSYIFPAILPNVLLKTEELGNTHKQTQISRINPGVCVHLAMCSSDIFGYTNPGKVYSWLLCCLWILLLFPFRNEPMFSRRDHLKNRKLNSFLNICLIP